MTPAVEMQSPNHWATWEVPVLTVLSFEQGASHFHFALSPAIYVAGPASL